jgi:hypothetical protein
MAMVNIPLAINTPAQRCNSAARNPEGEKS